MRHFKKISVALISIFIFTLLYFALKSRPFIFHTPDYSFLVAGHTYGPHKGTNQGLYPKFLKHLKHHKNQNADFLLLTGDIVRTSTLESWQTVESELTPLNLPSYFVLGNHDSPSPGPEILRQNHGNTFYSFTKNKEMFIILDSQKEWGNISKDQIHFLKKIVSLSSSKIFFIFMHELIWTQGHAKYKSVDHNMGSYNGRFTSNYWNDVHSIFEQNPDKRFIIFAGDVGGNPKKIPAFYEKLKNVEFIASGMGEILNENYLKVTVTGEDVSFNLIPLNFFNTLRSLKHYSL